MTSVKKPLTIRYMSHWDKIQRQWSLYTPPLTPHPEDVSFFKEAADGKGLLLGVTKELLRLSADMAYIDNNANMIKELENAYLADWLDMPFEDETFDFAAVDGGMTLLVTEQYPRLLSEIRRVLKTGGRFVVRAFTAPDKKETTEDVFKTPGKNFHAFKWRVAQSLTTPDLPVRKILEAFTQHAPDRSALPFAPELLRMIDIYEGSDTVYSFPTLTQLRAFFTEGWEEKSVRTGTYDLAERCPVICFQKCA